MYWMGNQRGEKMRKHWFNRFMQRNDYDTLPCYEEKLNCARKALEEIQ
jgi:hypothetical protein